MMFISSRGEVTIGGQCPNSGTVRNCGPRCARGRQVVYQRPPRQQHRQAILAERLREGIAGPDADTGEKENQPNLPLKHVDDNQRDVVLLSQRGRLPKTYLKEQLIR